MLPTTMRMEADFYPSLPLFCAHEFWQVSEISPWLQISSDSHVMQKVFSAGIHSQEFHGTQDVFNGIVFTVAFMWTDLEVKKQRQMTAMPSSWRVQDISTNPYIFSCIDTILSERQLAMLRKESSVPISCNISSSPRFIDVAFLGCACAEGTVGRHSQGLESVQDAFKQPQESR